MAETNISVACIGLGRMGAGIARNVQNAGFRLIVYNRTQEKAEPFITSGAALARTPREAAQAADVVVTSLMDDASVLDMVNGADGVLSGMRPGGVHAGTSTTSPNLSTRLTELHLSHGSEYVAAHVLGLPPEPVEGFAGSESVQFPFARALFAAWPLFCGNGPLGTPQTYGAFAGLDGRPPQSPFWM